MCKGIDGHGFYSTVEVPIIENTARECELTGRLREAIAAYPKSNAVLVRRHGVYVWGSTWQRAKAQAETYDYLFEAAVRLRQAAGIDVSRPPPGWQEGEEGGVPPPPPPPAEAPSGGPAAAAAAADAPPAPPAAEAPEKAEEAPPAAKKARASPGPAGGDAPPKAIVLDIEGTVLPISYVKEQMFPYARSRFGDYLSDKYETEEVREQLAALSAEQRADASPRGALSASVLERYDVRKISGRSGKDFLEGYDAGVILSHDQALDLKKAQCPGGRVSKAAVAAEQEGTGRALPATAQGIVVDCAVRYLEALTDADVKSTALKAIQGSIWHEGFQKGELQAPLFDDVPSAIEWWTQQRGIKVFIYSSGSKKAQMDLFAHTRFGNLSGHISGYFDTTSGAKVSDRKREKERRVFFLQVLFRGNKSFLPSFSATNKTDQRLLVPDHLTRASRN